MPCFSFSERDIMMSSRTPSTNKSWTKHHDTITLQSPDQIEKLQLAKTMNALLEQRRKQHKKSNELLILIRSWFVSK